MIKLSNDCELEYVAASGALGFDGRGWPHERMMPRRLFDPSLFTAIIKTLTLMPRTGNLKWRAPWKCIRPVIKGGKIIGMLNAVGLTNPGCEWWCENVGPEVDKKRISLIGSIAGNIPESVEMARMLNDFDLVGLEINPSCPNVCSFSNDKRRNAFDVIAICEAVKCVSRFPLLLKLSCAQDVLTIVSEIDGIVEALDINSVPWMIVFPNNPGPLAHLGGGGVSGKIAQPFTWDLLCRLVDFSDIPVIGPSVWNYADVAKLREIGAKAVGFGSVFIPYPWRPTCFVRRDLREGKNVL